MAILRLAMILGALAATSGLAVPTAFAQESEVVYRKHTVVDFGDDTIEGDLSKPDGAYIEARKKQRHQNLIKVRESFRQEILQSVRVL